MTAIDTNALNAAAASATAAPKVKLTRTEKLTKQYTDAVALIEKYTAVATEAANELRAIQELENVAEGSAVVITVGKGEAAKEVQGDVIGVKVEEDGTKLYKVAFGSGFDADHIVGTATKLKLRVAEAQAELEVTAPELSAEEQAQQQTQYA